MAKLTLEDAKWQVLDILATDGKVFRHELRKQDKVLVQAADFLAFAGEIEMGTNVMGQQVWYRLKGIEEAGGNDD